MGVICDNIICSIVIIFGIVIVNARVKDLPAGFPHCRLNAPDLDSCWIKASEQVRPYIHTGIPELNIPSMDPFTIPEVTLEQGTQALNFKAVLKDIKVKGLANYKITDFHFDVPNLQFYANGTLNELDLAGDYKVDGKILLAPIQGIGKFTASVDSTYFAVYQKVKKVQFKGNTYLDSVFVNTTISVGKPKAHLDGLFDGNEELSKVTNKVIEDNIDELFTELRPVLEKVITSIMEDLLLKGFEQNVPFDKLYPVD